MDNYLEVFAKKLKALREEKNVTLRDIEDATGISRTCISKYERCKSDPQLSVLVRLSEYFDVDIDWFIGKSDLRKRNESIILAKARDKKITPSEVQKMIDFLDTIKK